MAHVQEKKGLTLVYTGEGKGKTTAGLGLLLRAWGSGLRVGCMQFIKSPERVIGERIALEKMGISLLTLGKGFVFKPYNRAEHYDAAMEAWELTQQTILSQKYDMLMLDEFTYLLHFQWIAPGLFAGWLREHKPNSLHLIITGRYAPEALIEYADMVSEVKEVKHHYHIGIGAQAGIEF